MDRKSALQPYRGSLAVSASTLAVAVLLSVALWRLGLNGQPLVRAVAEGSLPLGLAAGILLVVAAATVAIHISVTAPSPSVSVEEPLLAAPRVPAIRRNAPFIVVLGITPKFVAHRTIRATGSVLHSTSGRSPGVSGAAVMRLRSTPTLLPSATANSPTRLTACHTFTV